MAESIENKALQLFWGVNASSSAIFRLCDLKSNLISLWRIMTNFKKALAFTLAETLIVMGIIGVVAALTLPNLNSSTGEKEKVAKLKKVYSNFQDAFGRMEVVYEPFEDIINRYGSQEGGLYVNNVLGDRLTEFMKISKNCERKSGKGCFAQNIEPELLEGILVSAFFGDDTTTSYKFVLADGTAVSLSVVWGGAVLILVDINGVNKGQHIIGKDIFVFGISPNDYSNGITVSYDYSDCFANRGSGCTGWVLNNGNLDYLKADSSGKCPNGKVLSETVTSCK